MDGDWCGHLQKRNLTICSPTVRFGFWFDFLLLFWSDCLVLFVRASDLVGCL
jgi:hypothetical protein